MVVISFDAVGDKVFEAMAADSENYPNIAAFKKQAYYQGGVKTVFVSNTYPVHTSICTGKLPKDHGIISNLLPANKNGERPWNQMAHNIRAKTVWQAAREKNLRTAAVLWPVTCGADIDYNMPEVHPMKGQNMLARSLSYGSTLFQLAALVRHRRKVFAALKSLSRGKGGQPALDDFTTAVACDTLKSKKPDLTLVHLIAYDTLFHFVGSKGQMLEGAKKAMDVNLGKILASCPEDQTVIVFSDHSQLDVDETIDLNSLYGNSFFEQAGGSAFAYKVTDDATKDLEKQPWFARYLTKEEMEESGYAGRAVFGIAAKPSYAFSDGAAYKGNHGYPGDYDDYDVFYAVRGKNFTPGHEQEWLKLKKKITDITAIIARELNLDMDI
jgi:predicted AlkP superfamily pyrophosphatase or phosphodiesterase